MKVQKIPTDVLTLINDPRNITHLLFSKYGDIREDYEYLYVDALIYSKGCHLSSKYKEYLVWDYVDEFLKRHYTLTESLERLPKLANYYKNYLKFFCNPLFRDFRKNAIIQSFGDNKAEIFYKNNYVEKNKKENKILDNNINSLNDDENEKGVNCNDGDYLTTIFDTTVRKIIDKNIITQNNDNNTLALQTCQSEVSNSCNNKNNLFTKRSRDESLVHMLSNFEKRSEEPFIEKINDRINKIQKPRESSSPINIYRRIKELPANSENARQYQISSSKDISESNKPQKSSENKSQTTAGKVSLCNIYKFKPWTGLDEQQKSNDYNGNSNSNQRVKHNGTPEPTKKSQINEFRNNNPKSNAYKSVNQNESGRFGSSRKLASNDHFIKSTKQSNRSTNFIATNSKAVKVEHPVDIVPACDKKFAIKPQEKDKSEEKYKGNNVVKYTKVNQSKLNIQTNNRPKSNGSSIIRNSNINRNFYMFQTSRSNAPCSSILYTKNVPSNKARWENRNASGNIFSSSNCSLQDMLILSSIRHSKSTDKGNNNMNMYISNNFISGKEHDSIKLTGLSGLAGLTDLKHGSLNLNLNVNLNSIHINTNSHGGNTDIIGNTNSSNTCSRNKRQQQAFHKKNNTISPINFNSNLHFKAANSTDEKGQGRDDINSHTTNKMDSQVINNSTKMCRDKSEENVSENSEFTAGGMKNIFSNIKLNCWKSKIDTSCIPVNNGGIYGRNGALTLKMKTKLVELLRQKGNIAVNQLGDYHKNILQGNLKPNEIKKKSKSLSRSKQKEVISMSKNVIENDSQKTVKLSVNIPAAKVNTYVRISSPIKSNDKIHIIISNKDRKVINFNSKSSK